MFRVGAVFAFLLMFLPFAMSQSQPVQTPQTPQLHARGAGMVYVKGYRTKTGKYVAPHWRRRPTTRPHVLKPHKYRAMKFKIPKVKVPRSKKRLTLAERSELL